jgi:hypothetical protein
MKFGTSRAEVEFSQLGLQANGLQAAAASCNRCTQRTHDRAPGTFLGVGSQLACWISDARSTRGASMA